MRLALLRTFSALLTLAPTAAFAHSGSGHVHGFADGFAHPLGGLDHILAMLSVGVLAWQLGARATWLLPTSFLCLMALGAARALGGAPLPFLELGIGGSVIVFGSWLALGAKAPLPAAMTLVGAFAIFHGYAHGADMPFDDSSMTYAAGFMGATALLHATGLALACLIGLIRRYADVAYRAAGASVALAGAGLLLGVI
jgi:urease accessory protein